MSDNFEIGGIAMEHHADMFVKANKMHSTYIVFEQYLRCDSDNVTN